MLVAAGEGGFVSFGAFSEGILIGSGDGEGVRLWLLQNSEEEGLVGVDGAYEESGGDDLYREGDNWLGTSWWGGDTVLML